MVKLIYKLLIALIICTGCNAEEGERKVDTLKSPYTVETIFGCWEATAIIWSGPIASIYPDEAKSIIGDLFCFDKDRYSFDSIWCDNPKYSISTHSNPDSLLLRGYKANRKDLDISDSLLIFVEICNCEIDLNELSYPSLPFTIFILGEDKLLIPIDAYFYLLRRVAKKVE